MSILAERPIFVVGAPRSGTTMLQYMLSSHPRIHILLESNFIPRFFQHGPRAPMKRQQAIHILNVVFNSYRYHEFPREWQGEQLAPATFVDGLPDLTPTTFIATLFSQYAGQFGAERWGDKSPIYTGYIDLIADIFPTAQFIHLIRDGRDVALSTVDAWDKERFYVDVYFAARSWKRRIRKAFASATRLGSDRYYELRYEQLTADPDSLLREICDFLGEVYVPEMAEPHRMARKYIGPKGLHAPVREQTTTKSSGRWRREMSKADQRLLQAVAGDLLDELGYETVDLGKMCLTERARFAGLQAKYAVLHAGRRALQTVGVFPPN
jgi:hypothetical protein